MQETIDSLTPWRQAKRVLILGDPGGGGGGTQTGGGGGGLPYIRGEKEPPVNGFFPEKKKRQSKSIGV